MCKQLFLLPSGFYALLYVRKHGYYKGNEMHNATARKMAFNIKLNACFSPIKH
jgi:hypothetical protein